MHFQHRAFLLAPIGILSIRSSSGFVLESERRILSSPKSIPSLTRACTSTKPSSARLTSASRQNSCSTYSRCSSTNLRFGLLSDASTHLSGLGIDDGIVTTVVAAASAAPSVVVSPEPIHTLFTVATFAPQPFFVLMILFRNSTITKTIMGGLGGSNLLSVCAKSRFLTCHLALCDFRWQSPSQKCLSCAVWCTC
jgi:hypothetical protein